MAAQRAGPPVPPSATPASSLLAPATPLTSQPGDASQADAADMIYDPSDPSLRRAQPDLPFFTEADAGARDGPLEHSLGFLIDLSQCVEALQIGFDGSAPLSEHGMDTLLEYLFSNIVAKELDMRSLARGATDFSYLVDLCELVEESLSDQDRAGFRRADAETLPSPCSMHSLLIWMVNNDYVILNIADSVKPQGYESIEIVRLSQLSGSAREEQLGDIDAFHAVNLESIYAGSASSEDLRSAELLGD